MPRRNPSLVGAKLSHQSARTPRSQASKPTPRQTRRPATEPSNRHARRNKFVTFYRGGHLRSGFQLRLRHPARKLLPARKLTRSNQRASRRARSPTCEASMRADCSSRSLGPETASYEGRCPRDARSRSRGARQSVGATWAQRERQRERIQLKRLIPHSTLHSHRLLSRKRRPRRGRQRRPPPTARPRRCGPDAGCEGSPQEAAALQSRRQWRHLGGR